MKLKLVALICSSLLSTAVLAQNAVITPPASPGAAPTAVNPFTGTPLSEEQLQRELDSAKIRTAYLEELLKQSNIKEELKNLPLRKAVEAAQVETAMQKEAIARKELDDNQKLVAAQKAAERAIAEEAAREARKKNAKPAATKKASGKDSKDKQSAKDEFAMGAGDAEAPITAAPVAPPPSPKMAPSMQLMSVIDLAGSRSAMLDIGGNMLVVQDGAQAPGGVLRVVDAQTVDVAGQKYRVHQATIGRIVLSDQKGGGDQNRGGARNAAEGASAEQGVPMREGPPLQAGGPNAVNNALSARLQQSGAQQAPGGQRATLPPLQLPQGVPVLPPHTGAAR